MAKNAQTTPIQTSSPSKIMHYVTEFLFWAVLILAFLFSIFPLYWMFVTSLKPRADVEMTSLVPT
jgi:ABC-type glycerol-3-phosphate transport system permease component